MKNDFIRGQTSLQFRHRWRLGLAQQTRRMMGRQRPQVARRPLLSAAVASVLSVATSDLKPPRMRLAVGNSQS
jgi:hypothetical protein